MKTSVRTLATSIIACLLLGLLVGCDRSLDDVDDWQAQGNVAKLIKALGDGDRGIRIAATQALGDLKAESAVEPLAKLLPLPDSKQVGAAIDALVSIGGTAAENHLIAALSLKDRRTCVAASLGLGALKSTQAVDPLIRALNDGDAEIATAAATALGLINDKRAVAPLVGQLESRSFSLRLACVESLGRIGGDTAMADLTIALGDINKDIRQVAIDLFVATGEQAIPYALTTLRDSHAQTRLSAIAILTALDAAPIEGNDLAWYLLAQVPTGQRAFIKPATVDQLTQIGPSATEALLQALAHDESNIREHAFRALENIGEPCVAQAIEAAKKYATPIGKQWFAERTSWQGAPSWRIDLWGAATALKPDFELSRTTMSSLRALSNKDNLSREYCPTLIHRLGNQKNDPLQKRTIDLFGADSAEIANEIDPEVAKQQLIAAGEIALFPLIAALGADNPKVVDASADILGEIGDPRAAVPLAEVLSEQIAAGKQLSHAPLYTALQKLDIADFEPTLQKVRPNADQAVRVFERKYQGSRVTHTEVHNEDAGSAQPIAFTVRHVTDGKTGEARMIFRRNEAGSWVPTPPLPAEPAG